MIMLSDGLKRAENYLKSQKEVTEIAFIRYAAGDSIPCGEAELVLQKDALRLNMALSCGEGSYIRIELWFPEEWEGRLIGRGNGGMAGGLPTDALIYQVNLNRVAVTTDMGTSRGEDSGIGNSDVAKDFGHRATHMMTVYAKALCPLLYGKEPTYSYFIGSSTGGQQALSLAQRYPEDYNAILCGVPANDRVNLHTYFVWNYVVSRDEKGNPLFTAGECDALADAAVAFMQERGDGEKGDGFVSMPLTEDDDLSELASYAAERLSLSPKQAEAYRKLLLGPVDREGNRIYRGIPCGSENREIGLPATMGSDCPLFRFISTWALGKEIDFLHYDFTKDYQATRKALSDEVDAVDADLSAFLDRGGKILIHSGTADPCVPFQEALDYSRRVEEKVGRERVENGFRFFLSPSFDHYEGGCFLPQFVAAPDGRNLHQVLFDWYEKDIPADELLCHPHGNRGEAFPPRILKPLVPSQR